MQSAFQKPSNPYIEFFNPSSHGYDIMEVTQEKPTCTVFGVETTQEPPQGTRPEKSVLARFEVPGGLVNLQRTDIAPDPGTAVTTREKDERAPGDASPGEDRFYERATGFSPRTGLGGRFDLGVADAALAAVTG